MAFLLKERMLDMWIYEYIPCNIYHVIYTMHENKCIQITSSIRNKSYM